MAECKDCGQEGEAHEVVATCSSGHPVELRCPGTQTTITVYCDCDPTCQDCGEGMAEHDVVARCAAGHPVEVRCPGGDTTYKVACACA